MTTALTAPPTATTQRRAVPTPAPLAPAAPYVSAILVVRNGARWLEENLDALARQTRLPDRLVVVDCGSSDGSLDLAQGHEGVRRAVGDVALIPAAAGLGFGEAVDLALAQTGGPVPNEWLWLLHDDSAAAPLTLARLLGAVRRSPSVGVAGPKVVQWDNPRNLVEIGHQLTRSGRLIAAPAMGEPDQGQYDTRTDVLAVGTSGMLVRRDVYEHLHGFDPAFGRHGGGLDFGWRAQLAGHRVIVVPSARVRDASARHLGRGADGADPRAARRARRRTARQVALTRCALWTAPALAGWIAVSSVVSALLLLVAKRPRHAWAELGDLGALTRPLAGLRSRWRYRGTKRLRREHLAGVFVTPGQAAHLTWDRFQEAITPERLSRRSTASPTAATETGPVAEEAEDLTVLPSSLPQQMATHPGLLAVVACASVAALTFRDAIRAGVLDARGAGLAGGELQAVATGSSGLWHAFRDSWHGAGLGTSTQPGPHLAVLAALTWLVERLPYVSAGRSPASVAIAWLMVAAMPLSAVTAYLAGRVVTRARWARGLVALAWGTSGVLVSALAGGRLTVVVAHILLPLVGAGFVLATTRRGTFTATFATALATAVVGAFVPLLLAVSVLAAAVMVLAGPGAARRLRAFVLLVVPTALLGPWVMRFVDDPRLILSGPGLLDRGSGPAEGTPAWQLALGQPDAGPVLLALLGLPLVVVAVASLARHAATRARSVGLTAAGLLALLGLAVALAAPRVLLGETTGADRQPAPASLWTGVGTQVYLVGLLAAVLLGSHEVLAVVGRVGWGWRRLVAGAAAAGLALAVVAGGVAAAGRGLGGLVSVGQDALPAVAVDQGRSALANRLLVIVPAERQVDFRLVGSEPGELLRDLRRTDRVTDPGLAAVVALLTSGRQDPTMSPGAQLADQGVGFVSLQAPAEHPLVRSLDATSGLTRLGTTNGQVLWRVLARPSTASGGDVVPPARVRIVDAAGGPVRAVDVSGPHGAVDGDVPAGAAGRKVVFAEAPEWARFAEVRFNGARLQPGPGGGPPAYALPPSAGHLVADLPPTDTRWFAAQMALLLLVVFLAIPFGNRRSRRTA